MDDYRAQIEHVIGIRRAAGYDEADVRELIEGLNERPAVAFAVELTEPATTQGAVEALRETRGYIAASLDKHNGRAERELLRRIDSITGGR